MKQSVFLTLVSMGLLVSGMTWAGPPDQMQETDDSYQSESMEEKAEESLPADESVDSQPVILTFEEAVAACANEEDLQACVDVKTGITEAVSEDPSAEDSMDSETDISPETEETECDPWMDGTTCPEE